MARLEDRSLETILMEELIGTQPVEGGVFAALEELFRFAPSIGGSLQTASQAERQLELEMGSQETPVEVERVRAELDLRLPRSLESFCRRFPPSY